MHILYTELVGQVQSQIKGVVMEIFMNVWLALNIVFGLFTSKNILIRIQVALSDKYEYSQSDFGKILDLIVISSCLAYYFTINSGS